MRRDSAKRHIWGCAPRRGLWLPNLNSAEVLVRRIYPPPQSFIVLCLLVRKLSCWHTQTHKQTDFRRKHSTFFATLRRWVTILASLTTCCPTTWMPIHAHFLGGWFLTCKAPQTDLVFCAFPVGLGMRYYKFLCSAVTICSTLVTIKTHIHMHHFDQLIWIVQPAGLIKTVDVDDVKVMLLMVVMM